MHVGQRLGAVVFSPSDDVFCAVFALLFLREALSAFSEYFYLKRRQQQQHTRHQASAVSHIERHAVLITGIIGASFLGNGLIDTPVVNRASNLLIIIISWVFNLAH